MYRVTMGRQQGVLIILTVTDRPVGGRGSLVEVLHSHRGKHARPDIQAEYDLASLGEVERVRGHYGDPLKWMVEYKGKVSVKRGDRIEPKE